MRIAPLFIPVSSSWMMILAAANADLHQEEEELSSSSIIRSSAIEQQQDRDLQMSCPFGEAWDTVMSQCVVVTCDSARACGVGTTCTAVKRICTNPNIVCHQYNCISSCPAYEEMDPVTGQCVPVYCSSARACPASTGRVCLRLKSENCEVGRPCPNFRCCPDTSRCADMACDYGRKNDADGCPTCECASFIGWGGMGGCKYIRWCCAYVFIYIYIYIWLRFCFFSRSETFLLSKLTTAVLFLRTAQTNQTRA
jgi:Antistasin family